MGAFLNNWIRSMATAAVICGAALAVTPGGKVKNILKVVCGAVMVMALISPLTGGESLWSALDMAKYRQEAADIARAGENKRTNMSKSIIKQELETYVLDKAQSLGVESLEVELDLRWSEEGFWYPYEIELTAPASSGRAALEGVISGELGVPAERQHWSVGNEEN